jgi:ribonuclease HII
MGILIGMDEAGYGPNFGPLVVAATVWEVAEEGEEGSGFGVQGSGVPPEDASISSGTALDATPRSGTGGSIAAIRNPQSAGRLRSPKSIHNPDYDLYARLRNVVAKSASERRIAIADSKALFHPGAGLRQLERGVHAFLLSLRASLRCWSELVSYCRADPDGHYQKVCWPEGFDCRLPVDATADELSRLGVRFTRACEMVGLRPVAIRARLVFPGQFNELVEHYRSKGAALSHVTVGLLREVIDLDVQQAVEGSSSALGCASRLNGPVYALCDKHGGRNYYTALLQHHFSEHWVNPVFESHAESRYEWGPQEARVRATFRMNGERFLPTALASMTAKYFRELAMRAFNEFWSARVPDLRPTAGYPVDSHRFRKAIAAAQRKLGIEDHFIWRKR